MYSTSGEDFCQLITAYLVRREPPARIIYQDEEVTAFHDAPPGAGPRPHRPQPAHHWHRAGGPEDAPLLGKMMVVARQLAEELKITDGYRLVVNSGPLSGQSVFHLHLHLLGGRPLRWPPG